MLFFDFLKGKFSKKSLLGFGLLTVSVNSLTFLSMKSKLKTLVLLIIRLKGTKIGK